jgi:hypothetical protein
MGDGHTWRRSREPLVSRMIELPYCKACKAAPLQDRMRELRSMDAGLEAACRKKRQWPAKRSKRFSEGLMVLRADL